MDFGLDTDIKGVDTPPAKVNDDEKADITNPPADTHNDDDDVDDHNDDGHKDEKDDGDKDTPEFAIEPGTSIEFEGNTYTVDDNGNVIDEKGNIFKKSDEVKAWKDSLVEDEEDNDNLLKDIQEKLGIDITDDKGNTIEFENTPEGISDYVTQVISNAREENIKEAYNTLFAKYPILNDVLTYYIANGNSLEGFGEVKDRSNIEVDVNNIEQQESIIKTAWKEQNRKGDVEGYIAYLKSSGTLADVAKEELEGLKATDKELKTQREEAATKAQKEEEENVRKYWESVQDIINKKQLGKYKLPDTIIRNVNGSKQGASLNDFFNYIYRVDKDGKSAYTHDLEKETPESRLNDEILRAYLKFTGGSYTNLVDMEINNKEVSRLKLVSKNNVKKPIKFTSPSKDKSNKIDFGI